MIRNVRSMIRRKSGMRIDRDKLIDRLRVEGRKCLVNNEVEKAEEVADIIELLDNLEGEDEEDDG